MINKIFRVLFNIIRFLGYKNFKNLLAVNVSAQISKDRTARFSVGRRFRTRRNVEINIRKNAEISIGDDVFINSGCIITAREKITIGNNVTFGPGVYIFDNDHEVSEKGASDNEFTTAPIIIGNNVWIGAGCVVLKGSKIGDNTIIAAGSIVKCEIKGNEIMIQKRENTHKPLRGGY